MAWERSASPQIGTEIGVLEKGAVEASTLSLLMLRLQPQAMLAQHLLQLAGRDHVRF